MRFSGFNVCTTIVGITRFCDNSPGYSLEIMVLEAIAFQWGNEAMGERSGFASLPVGSSVVASMIIIRHVAALRARRTLATPRL